MTRWIGTIWAFWNAATAQNLDRYDVLAYRLDLDFTRIEREEFFGTAEISIQTTEDGARPLLLQLRGFDVQEITLEE
ncbi:MAG: hypothetical protein RMM53_08945, partial [Bacteroidia bacterium]|nr:hypothetical protein [Bacteroidia bacterium]